MNVGPWQLIIVALVVLVLFGRGRISEMMGDFGKGIKSFKKGMTEEPDSAPAPQISQEKAPSSSEAKPAPADTGRANSGS